MCVNTILLWNHEPTKAHEEREDTMKMTLFLRGLRQSALRRHIDLAGRFAARSHETKAGEYQELESSTS